MAEHWHSSKGRQTEVTHGTETMGLAGVKILDALVFKILS